MQLLISLTLWIFVALCVAVDNLDVNLFDDAFLNPVSQSSPLDVNDPFLFDDASESNWDVLSDNDNQLNPLNSDSELSFNDGVDWDSGSSFVLDSPNHGIDWDSDFVDGDEMDWNPDSPFVDTDDKGLNRLFATNDDEGFFDE
jgi:hypothetical protein